MSVYGTISETVDSQRNFNDTVAFEFADEAEAAAFFINAGWHYDPYNDWFSEYEDNDDVVVMLTDKSRVNFFPFECVMAEL